MTLLYYGSANTECTKLCMTVTVAVADVRGVYCVRIDRWRNGQTMLS